MYKTFQFTLAAVSLLIGLNAINAKSAQALVNPFNFDVNIDSGPLNDNTYSGSFSYDDAGLTGVGSESTSVLNLDYTFEGTNYTEADAIPSSADAEVLFKDGVLLGLSYSTNTEFSFVPGFTSTNDAYFTYDVASGAGAGDVAYTAVPFGVDSTTGFLLLGGLYLTKKAINRRRAASK